MNQLCGKQKGLGVNQVPITTKQAVLIMAQNKICCTKAKETWLLTKSQLPPNRRVAIIAQTEVTQSN
jgi:hypothetical protein